MIFLNTTNHVLLLNNQNATDMDYHTFFIELTANSAAPNGVAGTTSIIGTTQIVPAPATGITRQVKSIMIRNSDPTTSGVVSIQKQTGAGTFDMTPDVGLLAGEALYYEDAAGWYVLDAQGEIKTVGAAGATGATGPAGSDGADGLPGAAIFLAAEQGEDGERGVPGGTGPQGVQGIQGTAGPQGPQGVATYLESEGSDGADGPPGPAGPQGPAGSTGGTGSQGPQGVATFLDGEAGLDGDPGPPGAAGAQGTPGTTGAQGPQGVATFLDGEAGLDGDMGPPGPAGLQGVQGTTGSPGGQGAPGVSIFIEDGLTGDDGAPGSSGPQGNPGTTGNTGAQGPQGVATFLDGDAGLDGDPGPPGAPGAAGAQGTAGTTGASGPMGPAVFLDGEAGLDGDIGPPGTGATGAQGIQGVTGAQGPAGSMMLPEDAIYEDAPYSPPMDTAKPVSFAGGTSAGKPGIYFWQDTTTGWYRPSADKIALGVAGVLQITHAAGFTTFGSSGATDYLIAISAAAGQSRQFQFQTSNVVRWQIQGNNSAETGTNAGSDLQIHRYDDAGVNLGAALTVIRGTGALTFEPVPTGAAFGVPGQVLTSRGTVGPPVFANPVMIAGLSMMADDYQAEEHPLYPPMDTRSQNVSFGGASTGGMAGMYFHNDPLSGLYKPGVNLIGMLINSAINMTWGAGALTMGNSSFPNAYSAAINTAAGKARTYGWQTAGVIRWSMAADATGEGGSNAGSDWILSRYDDAGAFIEAPLKIVRSNGNMIFGTGPWFLNSSTTNPGVAGQVITSQGPGAPPIWANDVAIPSPIFLEDIDPLGLSSEVIEGGQATNPYQRIFAGGSAGAGTWVIHQRGVLLTTPEDGAFEVDANASYLTSDGANQGRGVIAVEHIIRANATRTFTSNTLQQALFTTPANGQITLGQGVYEFEAFFGVDTMSATSGNGKWSLIGAGTATLTQILQLVHGIDISFDSVSAVGGVATQGATVTATNSTTANVATDVLIYVKGTFNVSATGTIIPSFAQTTAAAAVLKIGSYFKCKRMGAQAMTSVGNWT